MNTKAYIESGIIESYVLGLASAEEASELDMLCTQHEDIKNAVDAFEALMEAQAFENAVAPPPGIKDKIMDAISSEFKEEKNNIVPVISMQKADAEETMYASPKKIWSYLAAASIILLAVSTGLNFYFYNNYKSSNEKYVALLEERNNLQASNNTFRTNMNIMNDTDVHKILLKTVNIDQYNLASVFWNTKTKEVYLMPENMSALPSDKQYQLWAIVNGKPVNAGLVGDCSSDELCKMINMPDAEMFAITIENKGGSPTPTLKAMVVAGKI